MLRASEPSAAALPIGQVDALAAQARATGMGELDRVLGGGLVPGAVVLLAGEPGVGKSTLLLEAGALAATAGRVLYVTGEESAAQVRLRADRIGAVSDSLFLAAETDFGALLAHVAAVDPVLLIVDSIQTISASGVDGVPGGVTQVREITAALTALAKQRSLTTVLVGHVTKDGSVAGPRTLEHLVDVVLHFDGDSRGQLRMVRALKNRFGPTDEIGCFELGEYGLIGLPDPSGLFLSERHDPVAGTCVTVTLEGRRPLLAEVQTLVCDAAAELPRRVVSGLDSARVGMMIAVLQRRAAVQIGKHDVFAATVGGVRLAEPSVDLAVGLAIASSVADMSVPGDLVAIGEVGLAGEIRRVTGVQRRISEAERMGFRRAIVPAGSGLLPSSSRRPGAWHRRGNTGTGVSRHGGRRHAVGDRRGPGAALSRPASCAAGRLPVTGRAGTAHETVRPRRAGSVRQVLAVGDGRDDGRRDALAVVAPGTALRDGLERIVRGNTGALVVLGSDPVVAAICSGGFELDAPFSATRLRELAKMDGAIVVDQDGDRILRAAVQLVPDPRLPTQESGTRHRTAERVARQTGFPVITVSKSMRTIAVFTGGQRYVLEDSSALLARAHQALATLERYKRRADDAAGALTALEIEDRATVRDIAIAAQRLEMAARVTGEIAGYLVELGTDGGLLSMQLDELVAGTAEERALLLRDYAPQPAGPADAGRLAALHSDELLDLMAIAAAIGLCAGDGLDRRVSARGYRLLRRIPRLPSWAADVLVEHFGSLQKLLSASALDLQQVHGLDRGLATSVREGLARLAEAALLDRYP